MLRKPKRDACKTVTLFLEYLSKYAKIKILISAKKLGRTNWPAARWHILSTCKLLLTYFKNKVELSKIFWTDKTVGQTKKMQWIVHRACFKVNFKVYLRYHVVEIDNNCYKSFLGSKLVIYGTWLSFKLTESCQYWFSFLLTLQTFWKKAWLESKKLTLEVPIVSQYIHVHVNTLVFWIFKYLNLNNLHDFNILTKQFSPCAHKNLASCAAWAINNKKN